MTRRSGLLIGALALGGAFATPAAARTVVAPYLEVEQVFSADLSGGDDAVTYTDAAAGIDVSVQGPKLNAQIDYRYDHDFAWSRRYRDSDTNTGLARVDYALTPQLTLDGAAFGTRVHGVSGGPAPGLLLGSVDNTSQAYGFETGPSYNGQLGALNVSADYRYSWVHVDDGYGSIDLGPGQPLLDNGFTTDSHVLGASVGMDTGALPFAWTVSGGYTRDDIHFLDARYTGLFGSADVIVPVTYALALEAGAGYERNRAGEAQILTDASGNAILDSQRHLQPDHSKPRLLSYDEDGLIWDVGVLWRPDERTRLEIRGGRRYGETSVTGSFDYQISPDAHFQAVAYDDIESFGRAISAEIDALPTDFSSPVVGAGGGLQGCVFGASGGKGGCLPALNAVSSDFYRARGGYAMLSAARGPWTYGLDVGYERRHYLTPQFAPLIASIYGTDSQSLNADLLVARSLSRVSSLTGTVDAVWNDGGAGIGSYWMYGATGTYNRAFSQHLSGSASLSVYSGAGDLTNQDVIGSALFALRYQL